MKRLPNTLLHITYCVSLITLFLLLFTIPAFAQEPPPSPRCECAPGAIRYDCPWQTVPDGWCKDATKQGNEGRGLKFTCNDDCQGWGPSQEGCYAQCPPPNPQITPIHSSFEKSIGDFNEYTEGSVHSGTRDAPIDASNPNNYGAVAALVPAGGPNHELKVKFVKQWGDYEVYLASSVKKKAREIWNECTENGNLENWQAYQEKLENCQDWGFVPLTYRRLASEPTPAVKNKKAYFQDEESPFVRSWTALGTPLDWVLKFFQVFQDFFCKNFGWFCPVEGLPLRNPDNAPGWTKNKLNIPQEAVGNAQLLRQWLLPKDFPLATLPQGNNSYFDTQAVNPKTEKLLKETLEQTGQAAQQTSADAGLFRIFQPREIKPRPALCDENLFNPPEECASEYYFYLMNASPGFICGANKICYGDTPDQKTFDYPARSIDDRPFAIRTHMDFFQQGLWPKGLQ